MVDLSDSVKQDREILFQATILIKSRVLEKLVKIHPNSFPNIPYGISQEGYVPISEKKPGILIVYNRFSHITTSGVVLTPDGLFEFNTIYCKEGKYGIKGHIPDLNSLKPNDNLYLYHGESALNNLERILC